MQLKFKLNNKKKKKEISNKNVIIKNYLKIIKPLI